MTIWKPCISVSEQAMAVPSAVNMTEISTMKPNAIGMPARLVGRKPGDHADHDHDHALKDGCGRAAQRAADHEQQARCGRYQHFFQEAELAVEHQLDAGKDRGEEDRHADHAGREELDVVALPRFAKIGTEAKAETRADRAAAGRAKR